MLHVKGQQDIKNLQGRSVTLDILAVDTDNKYTILKSREVIKVLR